MIIKYLVICWDWNYVINTILFDLGFDILYSEDIRDYYVEGFKENCWLFKNNFYFEGF